MADEGAMQTHVTKEIDEVDVVSSKSILLKVIEAVIAILVIGLIVDPFDSFMQVFKYDPRPKLDDIALIYIAVGGFLIVNAIFILGHLLGDRMPKRTSLLFAVTGSILHIIAGILLVINWRRLNGNYAIYYNNNNFGSKQYMDMLIAAIFFTFLNGVVFAFDVFFTIRYF